MATTDEVYIIKLDTINAVMVAGVINEEAEKGARLLQVLDRMGVLWLFFRKEDAPASRKLFGKVA